MQEVKPLRRGWIIWIAIAGTLAAGRVDAQQTPPSGTPLQQAPVATQPVRNLPLSARRILQPPSTAVILNADSHAEALQRLNVKRRITSQQLRVNPVIALQDGQADMRPVLANPASLANVAQRLRQQPALAQAMADSIEVMQVDQGLVVHQTLSYRLKTGACTDPRKRASIAAIGLDCFTRASPSAHEAAFSDPADIRYVADPRKRAEVLATVREAALAQQLKAADGIAEFRAMLHDPVKRAEAEREFGAAEIARLATLDDAALEGEMVNAAEIGVEEVLFVPDRRMLSGASLAPSGMLASIGGDPSETASGTDPLRLLPPQGLLGITRAQKMEHRIEEHIYLTGFTLGREYEWSKGVSVSIKWCLIGCKETYYVKLYAGFNYGFGLRFPVAMGGSYHYEAKGHERTATFVPAFRTIDGSAADYRAAGLPNDKLFDGKELVLQAGANAGLKFRLPVVGSSGVGFSVNVDLTRDLPAPYASGQFVPPMPGQSSPPAEMRFENVDLIGGLANLGVAGGKVFPAIKFDLRSDKLEFRLTDTRTQEVQTMSRSGRAYPLSVDPKDHSSEFRIGDPVYDLTFSMTPGVVAQLFIDVRVWHLKSNWPVWFPKLTVELPPGGQRFSCHAGTLCTRNYRMSTTGAEETEGVSADPTERLPAEFAETFIREWKPHCPEERIKICETAITAVYTTYRNRMTAEMRAAGDLKEEGLIFNRLAKEAHERAKAVIKESWERANRSK
ncbi:MAG: hypothetical protein KIS72_02550 [Luteimonas sp.]|nr:hypothetical protein [Luteimonas sp.]